jgi:hypothetical protein
MTNDDVVRRLDALETQNRRLKQLLVAALALAAVVGARAQVAPAPVTGDRFVLVDASNHTRATLELAMRPQGAIPYPVLTFLDTNGKPRLRLGLSAHGPMLELVDENGKTKDYLAPAGPRPLTQG